MSDQELKDMGERRIVAELLAPRYRDVIGFGDDCAVLTDDLVVTTDTCPTPLVRQLGYEDLYYAGWLLATINLSDLAAAGAHPLGLVVNYTLPAALPVSQFERLVDGVDDCAALHGTRVTGGDLRDGPTVHLTATAIGRCAPGGRLSRRGAREGDRLMLIGSPGWLWAAVLVHEGHASLSMDDTQTLRERACKPQAQLKAGQLLASERLATSAMDVSDGLYASVRSICETNELGALMAPDIELDPLLMKVCSQAGLRPFSLAETWGDWSLLVTVRPEHVHRTQALLAALSIEAREIGVLTPLAEGIRRGDPQTPWNGIAQERFSKRSWHGTTMADLLTDLLK
ncbi:thiamine-monophosphate kinase [Lentzea sp. NBRC 105346]|uniref:thiamine-phosphate kinase n=1 Tax=Lentzea sp. NBRC 105346 TaxID=3032205 RepID=UPI0024A14A80|nr:thiamine-phosphate kinase [Lentzea sp. NBRC 105346]GLZ34833.1 thiamine-monophosphate kinase [Lentzea sp. NBRC 105346]